MDTFGDRMKMFEMKETGRSFMPLNPVYIRIDGKCFSKFTKNMKRPYDEDMTNCMVETTKYLVEQTNARIGYCQSDEISLILYSDKIDSQIWYDGKIFKIVSVLAAMATSKFTMEAMKYWPQLVQNHMPVFDCRAFNLPTKMEATNAILWREKDATKNAISMAARSMFSHKLLMNKTGKEMQEMMWRNGTNFNDYPAFFKRGTFIQRRKVEKELTQEILDKIPVDKRPTGPVLRNEIRKLEVPSFSTVTNRVEVIFDGKTPETELSKELLVGMRGLPTTL